MVMMLGFPIMVSLSHPFERLSNDDIYNLLLSSFLNSNLGFLWMLI